MRRETDEIGCAGRRIKFVIPTVTSPALRRDNRSVGRSVWQLHATPVCCKVYFFFHLLQAERGNKPPSQLFAVASTESDTTTPAARCCCKKKVPEHRRIRRSLYILMTLDVNPGLPTAILGAVTEAGRRWQAAEMHRTPAIHVTTVRGEASLARAGGPSFTVANLKWRWSATLAG